MKLYAFNGISKINLGIGIGIAVLIFGALVGWVIFPILIDNNIRKVSTNFNQNVYYIQSGFYLFYCNATLTRTQLS